MLKDDILVDVFADQVLDAMHNYLVVPFQVLKVILIGLFLILALIQGTIDRILFDDLRDIGNTILAAYLVGWIFKAVFTIITQNVCCSWLCLYMTIRAAIIFLLYLSVILFGWFLNEWLFECPPIFYALLVIGGLYYFY